MLTRAYHKRVVDDEPAFSVCCRYWNTSTPLCTLPGTACQDTDSSSNAFPFMMKSLSEGIAGGLHKIDIYVNVEQQYRAHSLALMASRKKCLKFGRLIPP